MLVAFVLFEGKAPRCLLSGWFEYHLAPSPVRFPVPARLVAEPEFQVIRDPRAILRGPSVQRTHTEDALPLDQLKLLQLVGA